MHVSARCVVVFMLRVCVHKCVPFAVLIPSRKILTQGKWPLSTALYMVQSELSHSHTFVPGNKRYVCNINRGFSVSCPPLGHICMQAAVHFHPL